MPVSPRGSTSQFFVTATSPAYRGVDVTTAPVTVVRCFTWQLWLTDSSRKERGKAASLCRNPSEWLTEHLVCGREHDVRASDGSDTEKIVF